VAVIAPPAPEEATPEFILRVLALRDDKASQEALRVSSSHRDTGCIPPQPYYLPPPPPPPPAEPASQPAPRHRLGSSEGGVAPVHEPFFQAGRADSAAPLY
jgi:hypothetical protein